MTKRDFDLLAKVIRKCWNARHHSIPANYFVNNLAEELEASNPKFDKQAFILQCFDKEQSK